MPRSDLTFDEYRERYEHIAMERQDGILQVTLHTAGSSLKWGAGPHRELGFCFADIGADRDNEVMILTGSGNAFCDEIVPGSFGQVQGAPQVWDRMFSDAKRLLTNLLDLEIPVIGAVNGPASIHAELALLSDIVLASDTATFADAPHFPGGLVPGDGVHVVWPALLGPNRGRYFLLTGQTLTAAQALDLGVVSEVLPRGQLLDRAWELARQVAARPLLTRRYARVALTLELRRLVQSHLGYGIALEGLAAVDVHPTDPKGH